jgi:hypothetical protein
LSSRRGHDRRRAPAGSDLLVSLLREEHLGRPGAARDRALAAASVDLTGAPVHLRDATYAALVAGEPRTAQRLLADCRATAPADDSWRRRLAACETWIWTRDRNWYPGDVAAEIATGDVPPFPVDQPGDPETRLVEAIASDVNALFSTRAQVEKHARDNPPNAVALVGATIPSLQHLQGAIQGVGAF